MLYDAWTNCIGTSASGFKDQNHKIGCNWTWQTQDSVCRIGFGWMVPWQVEPGQPRVQEKEWSKSREETKREVTSSYYLVSWASNLTT